MTKDRIRKEKNPEVREDLLKLLSKQQQDLTQREKGKQAQSLKSERLHKEREAVKNGKRPFYQTKCKLSPPPPHFSVHPLRTRTPFLTLFFIFIFYFFL